MCLKLFHIIFPLTCFILALLFIVQKMYMEKLKKTEYAAILAFGLAIYLIEVLVAVIILDSYIYKAVMFLFLLSPFIIGRLAEYKTETLYSFIQIFCFVLSGAFIFLI